MANTKYQDVTHTTALDGDEAWGIADDPSGTPVDRYITPNDIRNYISSGYQISVSVASSNLTVALKDRNGDNPSTSVPVNVKIGGTIRTITSALSVTKNAATNWCNAGGAELATELVQYFVYLGYNTTDGVVIGFSRIPYARFYSDFSATSTDETYCGISTITNATATDDYIVIGRFSATLSAGAGYTWSISGTGDPVHRPIHETDTSTWNPTISNLTIGNGTLTATYKIVGARIYKAIGIVLGSTSAIGSTMDISTVITRLQTNYAILGEAAFVAGGSPYMGFARWIPAGSNVVRILVRKVDGTYSQFSNIAATVPNTWTTSDAIDAEYQYDLA